MNLNQQGSDALDFIVERTGMSMTEAVNRALTLLEYWMICEAAGKEWHLYQDGNHTQVKILGA